jgi:hypothetical protein
MNKKGCGDLAVKVSDSQPRDHGFGFEFYTITGWFQEVAS